MASARDSAARHSASATPLLAHARRLTVDTVYRNYDAELARRKPPVTDLRTEPLSATILGGFVAKRPDCVKERTTFHAKPTPEKKTACWRTGSQPKV